MAILKFSLVCLNRMTCHLTMSEHAPKGSGSPLGHFLRGHTKGTHAHGARLASEQDPSPAEVLWGAHLGGCCAGTAYSLEQQSTLSTCMHAGPQPL